MKKSVKNVFNEGMLLDVHPSAQKNTTTRKAVNFRVITRDNNSFIITNVKGNELKGSITVNYVPLAVADKNGVAYILSAEVIAGVATGRGEIGTFPSPNYATDTGSLVYSYSPLMNYAGDANLYPAKDGPFQSDLLNFSLENIPDIELQNDYDGSVNVIIVGSDNPMRIVNSAFTIRPGKKYELIDRTGLRDTNRYTLENFENLINLISGSTKIMKIVFEESVAGGILPHGNTQYYFSYGTSDGNETEIVGQSFSVPVFNGDKVGNISGGRLTGEATNKMNRFTLSNLDESFAYVAVFVVHADGMNAAVKTAYKINQRYNILDSTMEFVHTGYEDKITIPVSDLEDKAISIYSAETAAQSNGYLMLGNVKEKEYDVEVLNKFSRKIKLGHKQVTLDMIGPEDNFTRVYDEPLNQATVKVGTDGYNGGYVNPRNIHDRLGYWGGEGYVGAVRYIFPDGSVSPLFPVVGIDNINNTELGTIEAATDVTIDALDATNGFSTDGKILNSKGIYRFPNRNVSGNGLLFSRDTVSSEGRITVNGITFKIPALNTDLRTVAEVAEGAPVKTIKDSTIGIQFFRGERKADALIQGTMIDCQMVPLVRHDTPNENMKLWNYPTNGDGAGAYTDGNSKLIPAYNHILESIHRWDNDGGDGRTNQEDDDENLLGLMPFKLNVQNSASNRDPHVKLTDYKSPFALISSDFIVNPIKYSGISSKDISARLLYRMSHNARVATSRIGQSEGTGDHFSTLIPVSSLLMSTDNIYAGQTSWTPDGLEAKNSIGFSSKAFFQTRSNPGSSNFALFRNKYNAYLGIRLQTLLRAGTPSLAEESGGTTEAANLLGKTFDASFLVNIYSGIAQRSAEATKQVYQNVDGIQYFPISGRMYWDSTVEDADLSNTLEGQLDVNRKITLYNGDCFINYALRKLYNNAEFDDPGVNINDRVRIGYTIGIVNEGNENASFRSLETIDLVEGERKHPFAYISKFSGTGDSYGRNNQWREYHLTESSGHNKGFSSVKGSIPSVTLPQDAPYIQNHWRTRVWHSGIHIQNSFENGYRMFFRTSYKDYPTQYGQIVKLISNNNQLYCIQENSVGIIPINERIQTGSDSAGPVHIEAPTVLGPKMAMLSEEVGSRHKQSIKGTDNAVYGVSLDRSVIWHTADKRLVLISDMAIRSYLDDNFGENPSIALLQLSHNIVTSWNKKFDEVLFTIYSKESGSFVNDRSFTVQFSETSRKIHSFYSFVPVQYFNLNSDLHSFNVKSANNQFWLHDSDNVPMNNFYGVQEDSSLAYAVNEDIDIEKGYSNLSIESNRVMPKTIRYKIPGASTDHDLVFISGNRLASNTEYSRGRWNLAIPKIKTIHNQDIEQKVADTKAGSSSQLAVGSRLKSNYAIIELVYNTDDLIELRGIITHYKLIR